MKFRYAITNEKNETVTHTNDYDVAKFLSKCEDFFVVDKEKMVWIQPSGEMKI